MKNRIRLTESCLNKIIKESVKKVLKENRGIGQELDYIKYQLEEIVNSGYIPFSSPSPSSTEMIVKKNILQAIECLKNAVAADAQLY